MFRTKTEPLQLVLAIVAAVMLCDAVEVTPPVALGAVLGLVYLALLARRTIRSASSPKKRRTSARRIGASA